MLVMDKAGSRVDVPALRIPNSVSQTKSEELFQTHHQDFCTHTKRKCGSDSVSFD